MGPIQSSINQSIQAGSLIYGIAKPKLEEARALREKQERTAAYERELAGVSVTSEEIAQAGGVRLAKEIKHQLASQEREGLPEEVLAEQTARAEAQEVENSLYEMNIAEQNLEEVLITKAKQKESWKRRRQALRKQARGGNQ